MDTDAGPTWATSSSETLANAINDCGMVVGAGVASHDPGDIWDHSKDRGFSSRAAAAIAPSDVRYAGSALGRADLRAGDLGP